MQFFIYGLSVLTFLVSGADAQGVADCSGQRNRFPPPDTGFCFESWLNSPAQTKRYPQDYERLNYFEILKCPSINKRIFLSNAIPNHDVVMARGQAKICEVPYAVELPLDPVYDADVSKSEIPIRGIIAMTMNGVPTYGAQEAYGDNAVEVTSGNIYDARFWYGHPSQQNVWHVHNPNMGKETVTADDLLGYAMDGFPIYGPLDDNEVEQLDSCNGFLSEDGSYRYHVRTLSQVDEYADYCNGDSVITNWNYVLGCYSGDISETVINDWSANEYLGNLPSDCVVEMSSADTTLSPTAPTDAPTKRPTPAPTTMRPTAPTESPTSWPTPVGGPVRPNIIIMQPDDLAFMDAWTPPPNKPVFPDEEEPFPSQGMPNIERLRLNGLQMMQAYAAAPTCGTSRYSTITGKYPSRAASVRDADTGGYLPAEVSIPTTKLKDIGDHLDCSKENIAVTFKDAGYETGMFGKWHLAKFTPQTYSYQAGVDAVKTCGFDTVGGLYVENLRGFGYFDDGTFSHNMEWVTWEAINFLNETAKNDDPFFMYFNPTVPHGNSDVEASLNDFTCQQTANSNYVWDSDPWIKGMSEDGGCAAYRQSVMDRAEGIYDNLGKIWLDDAVGALLHVLENNGQLENTVFVFQEDHGVGIKSVMYEPGVRIPQFVHYPARISPGTKFEGLVSTIDVGATMLDFAGIDAAPYNLDGKSWKDAIGNRQKESYWKNDRCIFFESEQDRGVRCGCWKYMELSDTDSKTYYRGENAGLTATTDGLLFDLCDGGTEYILDNYNNREADNRKSVESLKAAEIEAILRCHLDKTNSQATPDYSLCGATQSPTATPTATPTPSPTKNPTPSPTNPPVDTPTAPPTTNPTKNPTTSPPVDTPTAPPTTNPTKNPTKNPTLPPTPLPTSPPTEGDACVDSPYPARINRTDRSCAWIKDNGYCGTKMYWRHCRATCDKCDRCFDSSQKMPIYLDGYEYMRQCSFVRKENNANYCNGPETAAHCPKACGLCS